MNKTKRVMELSIAVAFVALMFGPYCTSAQSSSCTTAIISLAPCLAYITGNLSTPSSSCCSQLSSVVSNQAQCLCTLLNGGGSSFGVNINQTQALALPGACKVKTPPVSLCKAVAGGPASSPSSSPAIPATPSSTPSTPGSSNPTKPDMPSVHSVPSGSGSKTTPSTTGESSDGSSYKATSSIMFSGLFIAVFVSSLAVF